MNGTIDYSSKKDDLYFPCKNAQFFSAGAPQSDAALCVELARLAYCRSDTGFALNQAKITNELSRIGFTSAGFFESQGRPQGRGTHCFLALREDADLEQALQAIRCRMLFTGHSLGAALATLLASVRPPAALYTFGSPLVGDADFVATLKDEKSFRYVDCCDIVARIPPEGLGYRHLGKPYYIAQDRTVTLDPGDDFIKKDRIEAFFEYPFKYESWKKENVGVRELADHAPVNYVSAVTAARPPA